MRGRVDTGKAAEETKPGGGVVIVKERWRRTWRAPFSPHLQLVLPPTRFPRPLWTSMRKEWGVEGKSRVLGSPAGCRLETEKSQSSSTRGKGGLCFHQGLGQLQEGRWHCVESSPDRVGPRRLGELMPTPSLDTQKASWIFLVSNEVWYLWNLYLRFCAWNKNILPSTNIVCSWTKFLTSDQTVNWGHLLPRKGISKQPLSAKQGVSVFFFYRAPRWNPRESAVHTGSKIHTATPMLQHCCFISYARSPTRCN